MYYKLLSSRKTMKNQNHLLKGNNAPIFIYNTPWERELEFDPTKTGASILFFLRYIGCPVCQFELAKIKRDIALADDYKVYVVLQSDPKIVASKTEPNDWPLTIVCDKNSELFRLYNVLPGSILDYLNPKGLVTAIKALFHGHFHGKFEGNETQLPAIFVISRDKKIEYAYYGKAINDVPSIESLKKMGIL
ncbi:hypothetical protein EHQ43_15290 [Leptospira bouyouniensis]|uniref:Alkyl hydroperoxide reductase subunit C/ Thiol specific antioxidant domain-containing protein n=1 Tax=Leptospira bouyouniensis TaxID=2484911 RepID=A0A7I0HNB4_9LEPT|nr:hypothetical protein EHQ43_15290 [Leptospira bouyouniensis]TGM80087.1 hypothetical protein EHQ99_10255 [Leptospira bouyouniensis]